jgi:hypothetical protein
MRWLVGFADPGLAAVWLIDCLEAMNGDIPTRPPGKVRLP